VSCTTTGSARSALELIESAVASATPYDLALLDLNMPDIDGNALARMIRERPALAALRIVLLELLDRLCGGLVDTGQQLRARFIPHAEV
jgi:CheY-like chemotaxis protein